MAKPRGAVWKVKYSPYAHEIRNKTLNKIDAIFMYFPILLCPFEF
ncbi:MAG: hypothetical protein Q7I99_08375 [Acholeplasmataceae bacterium]|nr:hypothetical protein [Acholeplasmataceae bacterium]